MTPQIDSSDANRTRQPVAAFRIFQLCKYHLLRVHPVPAEISQANSSPLLRHNLAMQSRKAIRGAPRALIHHRMPMEPIPTVAFPLSCISLLA